MTTSFDNVTDETLADEIGKLDREARAVKARLDAAKTELKMRGIEVATGERFKVKVTVSTRKSLDTAAIRKAFAADVLEGFQRLTDVFAVRVSAA